MTKFQLFNLIKGLQIGALDEEMVLVNTFEKGTIRSVFTPHAKVNKTIVPGSYIWIWADDNHNVEYIDGLINDTLHIEKDEVAEWIQWEANAEPRKHYILLVDKLG